MSSLKLIYYHYKREKEKNKGISRGLVIQLIAIVKRFLSKI